MKHLKSTILILMGLLLTLGCASAPIKSLDLGIGKRTTTIKFEDPLFIPVPREDSQEVRDWILTGLFIFEHSRFSEATEWFLATSEKISDKKSDLLKETLMAAAVSALASGDRIRFIQVMERINGGLSRFERIGMDDKRWVALNTLYEEIKEGGLR